MVTFCDCYFFQKANIPLANQLYSDILSLGKILFACEIITTKKIFIEITGSFSSVLCTTPPKLLHATKHLVFLNIPLFFCQSYIEKLE